eukprot:s1203_g6.t1
MPIEHNYGGWRACLWKSNQRVRGPVRETLEKAAKDLTHLQEVHQESLAAPQARATAVTAEAISSKSSEEKLHQTLVDTMPGDEAAAVAAKFTPEELQKARAEVDAMMEVDDNVTGFSAAEVAGPLTIHGVSAAESTKKLQPQPAKETEPGSFADAPTPSSSSRAPPPAAANPWVDENRWVELSPEPNMSSASGPWMRRKLPWARSEDAAEGSGAGEIPGHPGEAAKKLCSSASAPPLPPPAAPPSPPRPVPPTATASTASTAGLPLSEAQKLPKEGQEPVGSAGRRRAPEPDVAPDVPLEGRKPEGSKGRAKGPEKGGDAALPRRDVLPEGRKPEEGSKGRGKGPEERGDVAMPRRDVLPGGRKPEGGKGRGKGLEERGDAAMPRRVLPAETAPPGKRTAPGGAAPGVWEFSVKDGFKAFDKESQDVVEALHQAFLAGGDRLGRVPMGKHTILVDFVVKRNQRQDRHEATHGGGLTRALCSSATGVAKSRRMLSGEEVDSMPVGELTDVKELKLHLVLLLHTIARSQAPHPRESRLPFIFFGWVRVATFGFCRKGPTTGALDYCVLTQLRSMLL